MDWDQKRWFSNCQLAGTSFKEGNPRPFQPEFRSFLKTKVVVRVTLFKENSLKTSEIIQIGKKDTPGITILLQSDRLNIKMSSKILLSIFISERRSLVIWYRKSSPQVYMHQTPI